MRILTSSTKGAFLNPASGAAGSATYAFTGAVSDALAAVWDSLGAGSAGAFGPASGNAPCVLIPWLDLSAATASWDFVWCLVGRDSLPATWDHTGWMEGGQIIVPPTRALRATANIGVGQAEPLHTCRYYALIITSTATHPNGNMICNFKVIEP